MIRLIDKSKISLFSFFYVFCFLAIYAGQATVFAREIGDIRTLGNGIALALTVIFIVVNKISFSKQYFLVIGIYLIYAFTTAVYYRVFNWWWISINYFLLTYAYVLCKGLGKQLFVVLETLMYYLSIISLIFWVVLLIAPGPLGEFIKAIQFSETYQEGGNVLANCIVFTLGNQDYGIHDFHLIVRNPGFMWEAGAFSCLICLAIFCNILRTNLKLNKNFPLLIFLITLFSTQSTTGFVVFVLMIAVWMINERKFGLLFLVGIPLALTIYGFSFVGDKIMSEQQNLQNMDIGSAHGAQGRFFSLVLDWEEFLRHPILGLGSNAQNTWLSQQGYEISTISGIGGMLSIYGLIITSFFLLLLWKSCRLINIESGGKNGWILIVVILGMMISYGLWRTPIYMAFWMYCVFSIESKSSRRVSLTSKTEF